VPNGQLIAGAWLFCVLIAGLHRLALPTLRRDLARPG
jgi:hypothetical protein